jgi:hypothetical protein
VLILRPDLTQELIVSAVFRPDLSSPGRKSGSVKVQDEERGVREDEGASALKGLLIYMKGKARYRSVYKLAVGKQCTGGMKQGTETVCCQWGTEVWLVMILVWS